MDKQTGGSAFPDFKQEGLTMRDYFAAAALPAMIAAYIEANGRCIGADHFPRNVPTLAYRMADAMLAVRSAQ